VVQEKRGWKAALGRRDVAAGLFMFALGAVIAFAAFDLRIGTPARMGPGFLPLGLGLLMAVAGIVMAVNARAAGETLPDFVAPWPLLILVAAFAGFAFLIENAGLMPAGFAAVLIASAAARGASSSKGATTTRGRRLLEALLYAAMLAGFATLVFVEMLGMPLRVWP
jgi:hypothetical protein